MTIDGNGTIWCDWADKDGTPCGERVANARKYYPRKGNTRTLPGWSRRGNEDYCPNHACIAPKEKLAALVRWGLVRQAELTKIHPEAVEALAKEVEAYSLVLAAVRRREVKILQLGASHARLLESCQAAGLELRSIAQELGRILFRG